MTRVEFLKQLEYLLQDLDEKDREDALNYYKDYMDEAGLSDHDIVDGVLDMPERIAMSLRASLNTQTDENVEYSEQGYININVEPEDRVPDVYGGSRHQNSNDDWDYSWQSSSSEQSEYHQEVPEVKNRNLGKWILIGILCILGFPLILGVGGGVIGIVFGIFGGIIGLVFGLVGGALGFLIGGVVTFGVGIGRLFVSTPQGLMVMGIALLMIAVGILLAMFTVVLCSRFIPWLIRSIVGLFRGILNRKGGA